MARLTVQEVIDNALGYAELSEKAVGGAIKALALYNNCASRLHNLLVNADENYAVKTTGSKTISADTPTYALPDDFMRARKVFVVSGGNHYPCAPFSVDEIDGHDIDDITAGSYDLWYVPRYRKALDAKEEVPFIVIDGWDDYVAWSMAAIWLGKRGEDPTYAISERDRLENAVVATAEPRDEEPGRIVDVSGRWGVRPDAGYSRDGGVYRFYSIEGALIRFLEVA